MAAAMPIQREREETVLAKLGQVVQRTIARATADEGWTGAAAAFHHQEERKGTDAALPLSSSSSASRDISADL